MYTLVCSRLLFECILSEINYVWFMKPKMRLYLVLSKPGKKTLKSFEIHEITFEKDNVVQMISFDNFLLNSN